MQPLFAQGVRHNFGENFVMSAYPGNRGSISISFWSREEKHANQMEFLAVGFASMPRGLGSSSINGYLLPLAHGFLGAGSWWNQQPYQVQNIIEDAKSAVVALAEISRELGGLRSVNLVGPDLFQDFKDLVEFEDLETRRRIGRELRDKRQEAKFQLALTHYHQLGELEDLKERFPSMPFHDPETMYMAVAQLYTLSRAMGVKEIIPKIIGALSNELYEESAKPTPREISVRIAKYKRNFLIPN